MYPYLLVSYCLPYGGPEMRDVTRSECQTAPRTHSTSRSACYARYADHPRVYLSAFAAQASSRSGTSWSWPNAPERELTPGPEDES